MLHATQVSLYRLLILKILFHNRVGKIKIPDMGLIEMSSELMKKDGVPFNGGPPLIRI